MQLRQRVHANFERLTPWHNLQSSLTDWQATVGCRIQPDSARGWLLLEVKANDGMQMRWRFGWLALDWPVEVVGCCAAKRRFGTRSAKRTRRKKSASALETACVCPNVQEVIDARWVWEITSHNYPKSNNELLWTVCVFRREDLRSWWQMWAVNVFRMGN